MKKVRFVVARYTETLSRDGRRREWRVHEAYYQPRPVPLERVRKAAWKWDGSWRGGDGDRLDEIYFILIHPVPARRRLVDYWS